jgi:hypothetical protein
MSEAGLSVSVIECESGCGCVHRRGARDAEFRSEF